MNNTFTVTTLNTYIKSIFDNNQILNFIRIEGELLDVKYYKSEHLYFTLVDEKSSISAVMFSFDNKKLNFIPKNGDKVLILGSVSTYVKTGKYQIYVKEMFLSGDGLRLLKLEQLKKKLEQEGLFDDSHKKQINLYPNKIGIITGKGSAAASDLIKNISRRYPICKIYTFYSLVQGEDAPKDLVKSLKVAETYDLDTIIIGRGGGSNDDLNAFNDEELVREAYKCNIPIIAAVGHEIDYTLLDYVADKRASTPTGAAELATIDKREIYETLDYSYNKMYENIKTKLNNYNEKITLFKSRPLFKNPKTIYENRIKDLNLMKEKMIKNISYSIFNNRNNINLSKEKFINVYDVYLKNKRNELSLIKEKLFDINPKRVLDRGYAIINDNHGKIIKSVNDININDEIVTSLKDGRVISKTIRKEK